MHLKIADFGSAKRLGAQLPSTTYISSRWYRAPELILGRDLYTVSVDMWGFGCMLAEAAMGSPIFQGDDNIAQLVCTLMHTRICHAHNQYMLIGT